MYRTLVKKDRTEIVREYPPIKKNITVATHLDLTEENEYDDVMDVVTYFLQFPTMLFMHKNFHLHVAFCKTPIKSLNDKIYCPTIGNVYYGWRMCGCDSNKLSVSINKFWTKSFTDEGDCGPDALDHTFKTYNNWKKIKTAIGVSRKLKNNPGSLAGRSMTFKKFLLMAGCLDSFKIDLKSEYINPKKIKCYPPI